MKQVLYFTATWCGPCKMIKPRIQEAANQIPIKFVDVDSSASMASYYNVKNIPCAILIDEFGSEQSRLIGNMVTAESIKQMFNK